MTHFDFDLVVLGAGSGGYAAALRAAELGSTVALIERDKVGGTCLHRGCVPTKALLHAGEVADTVRGAGDFGITAQLTRIDAAAVGAYRDGIVAKKHKGLEGLIKARGITTVLGGGVLDGTRTVRVGEDTYTGKNVVIATGAHTRELPGITLGERILSSDSALQLDVVPESVIVLGGGVIGVEFASAWRSLGAEVTIVEGFDHLVANEDEALSRGLERAYRKRGIAQRLGTKVVSAVASEDRVTVTLEDSSELTAAYVLVAVGRTPATASFGLEAAGVELDERGFVQVDDHLRTTAEGVWAVGDIVAGLQLAHRGFAHGIAVAERIAGISAVVSPDAQVPRVTYSHPEVASVGVTEAQARAQLGDDRVVSTEFNLAGNAKSEILGTGGFVKIVREKDGPVLGVHLLGDRVGELITEGQLAVSWEAFPEDLAPLLHAHPTQSEALGEAFLALANKPLHSL